MLLNVENALRNDIHFCAGWYLNELLENPCRRQLMNWLEICLQTRRLQNESKEQLVMRPVLYHVCLVYRSSIWICLSEKQENWNVYCLICLSLIFSSVNAQTYYHICINEIYKEVFICIFKSFHFSVRSLTEVMENFFVRVQRFSFFSAFTGGSCDVRVGTMHPHLLWCSNYHYGIWFAVSNKFLYW